MSKAATWYEAEAKVQRIYQVADGIKALAYLIEATGPHLDVLLDPVRVAVTEKQAVAFAYWLLDTFGEGGHDTARAT